MKQIQRIGLYTILRKEWVRIFRIWPQTLVPSVITTTLYFLIFGRFIGDRIGLINGVPYIDFIVPGLIMMATISNAYGNVVSSFFGSKFQGHIEELMVSPLKNSIIIIGYVGGGVIRGVVVGVLVTIVASIFSDLHFKHVGLMVATMFLTTILFSLAGFINAIFARNFDDISIIPNFVLTPLTYLGGIFYSIQMLPEFWQNASLLNPILYLINLFRYALLGISDIPVTIAFITLLAFVALLWTWALHLMKKDIR